MCSRRAASVAAGTNRRTSHAAANAAPTRPTSRSTKSGMPISMATPASSAARGGSVIGTRAVARSTATTASDASRPTNSAIATDDTMGDAAAIRISASPRDDGRPSGRSTATSAATASGEATSSQTTSRASSAGRARQAVAAPQSRRTSANASGITSVGTSSGCAIAASGGAARPSSTPAAISRVAWRPIHARPSPRMNIGRFSAGRAQSATRCARHCWKGANDGASSVCHPCLAIPRRSPRRLGIPHRAAWFTTSP